MRRSRFGAHGAGNVSQPRARIIARVWRKAAAFTAAAAALALVLPAGFSGAQTREAQPSLSSLVATARGLSYQINALSEQYDGLRIQLGAARTEAREAQKAAAEDAAALKAGRAAVARLASASYMNAGVGPAIGLLTSSDPQQALSEASIVQQLGQENGIRVTRLARAEAATARASETAQQQITRITALRAAMRARTRAIQSKIDQINGTAMRQAMAIFAQTGQYPSIGIPGGNSVGDVALRYALTRRGDPYVWAAAGPGEFDCSGLVVWAFAQEGISLPHYTGSLWDSGEHIGRSQLEPGDLVFFYTDISHVGIYAGNGLMVDAPNFGQPVQVEPVWWNVYVGAVRIQA